MTECVKQANQRGLGWISTRVLMLFAFLITLPFAGQSVALSAHSNAEMATVIAPLGNLTPQILAASQNFTSSRSHDHHKLSSTREARVSHSSKMCVSMGHVTHKTHICCFDGTPVEGTILRRDLDATEKLDFASTSKVPFGPGIDRKSVV